ncbi:MAG: hypothetical protein KJ063_12400 [Anaerolineae bacterium]|nr:hypothetical protein [Anaerolineae bacterium]
MNFSDFAGQKLLFANHLDTSINPDYTLSVLALNTPIIPFSLPIKQLYNLAQTHPECPMNAAAYRPIAFIFGSDNSLRAILNANKTRLIEILLILSIFTGDE